MFLHGKQDDEQCEGNLITFRTVHARVKYYACMEKEGWSLAWASDHGWAG